MTSQAEQAKTFTDLHIKGNPIILYNIWDVATAKVVQEAGATAIATGSHSVAGAHGYDDGEQVPLDFVVENTQRIVNNVTLPVTIDFESGYAREPEVVQHNVARIIEAGAVGINFEDQIIGGNGLYAIAEQQKRITAIRQIADHSGIPFFINARTDVFLKTPPADHNVNALAQAIERGRAYTEAGASGIFVPGLRNPSLIKQVCDALNLPVNIMFVANSLSPRQLADLGVGRISYGPYPYRQMLAMLKTHVVTSL